MFLIWGPWQAFMIGTCLKLDFHLGIFGFEFSCTSKNFNRLWCFRTWELFYYLKGGQVDYGEEHIKACGHSQFGLWTRYHLLSDFAFLQLSLFILSHSFFFCFDFRTFSWCHSRIIFLVLLWLKFIVLSSLSFYWSLSSLSLSLSIQAHPRL